MVTLFVCIRVFAVHPISINDANFFGFSDFTPPIDSMALTCYDDDYQLFNKIHRWLSNPQLCERVGVQAVVDQKRIYSALDDERSTYSGKRMMVVMHAHDDDDSGDDARTVSLYEQIGQRKDMQLKVAATYLADLHDLGELAFDELWHPFSGYLRVLFLSEPYSRAAECDIMGHLPRRTTCAFVLDTDDLAQFIRRYASEFRRLDAQFHCSAWAADEAWWDAPLHERGAISADLIALHYGNELRQAPRVQPTLDAFVQRAV